MDSNADGDLPEIEISVAILLCEGKCWIQRRQGGGHLDGYWEFPGGKLEAGESLLEALIREVREETGLSLEHAEPNLLLSHSQCYPTFKAKLHFYLCRVKAPAFAEGGRWVAIEDLEKYAFPPANRGVLRALRLLPRTQPEAP